MDARRAAREVGLPDGARLVPAGGHCAIVMDDGTKLRLPNGVPVMISLSPGSKRSRAGERAKIARALRHRGVA